VLSKHSVFVRRVHAILTTSLHVLRHERHRAVHSTLRSRHGRLLSAAGCWREREGGIMDEFMVSICPPDGDEVFVLGVQEPGLREEGVYAAGERGGLHLGRN